MAKGLKILVVDDHQPLRQSILDILTWKEYDSVGAADGHSGLQLAEDVKPDLIILDVMMPDLDGVSVLKTLRSKPNTRAIPVLLLTAIYQDQIPASSAELGQVQYVTKPFAMHDLLAAIEACLATVPST